MLISEAQAPGKLYLAGEYAVVNPGNPALLMAVNRYVEARVSSSERWLVTSAQFSGSQVVMGGYVPANLSFASAALEIARNYASKVSEREVCGHVHIDSHLQSDDGTKFGLGSSAAVCVAVVRAVLAAYGVQASPVTVFKLAATAHFLVQGNGSLGDVAASSMGGLVYYRSPDREWLRSFVNAHTAPDQFACATADFDYENSLYGTLSRLDTVALVEQAWPDLVIEQVSKAANLEIEVGWTGKPASTKTLVKKAAKPVEPAKYQAFLHASARSVDALRALVSAPTGAAVRAPAGQLASVVAELRAQLNELSALRDVEVETDELRRGIEIALAHGFAAKSSGAGGGDCLIALRVNPAALANSAALATVHDVTAYSHSLREAWLEAGITPLALSLSPAHTTAASSSDFSAEGEVYDA
ncbi:MAG TPA: hypothetical protein K8U78_03480 [Aeriscardovia aeriphila]|uniref:phosphomevalonate kinase n=1 Tax=Aeriscardovia aeriphila TaxID=218139 RepID=A0A921KAQ7_9BIFI|nr:hypothetical protein [Aeriscardovia aeriphila]